jgi:hypothetical protein
VAKGAWFTARKEFCEALRLIAAAGDAREGSERRVTAFDSALTALDEAEELAGRTSPLLFLRGARRGSGQLSRGERSRRAVGRRRTVRAGPRRAACRPAAIAAAGDVDEPRGRSRPAGSNPVGATGPARGGRARTACRGGARQRAADAQRGLARSPRLCGDEPTADRRTACRADDPTRRRNAAAARRTGRATCGSGHRRLGTTTS